VGIGGDGGADIGTNSPDVDTFVDRFEQPRKRGGPPLH
jgi:hypothetical protein